MYVAYPVLVQPPDDVPLWRYTTLTSFLSLLLQRSLFFATLDSFEDPFEGVPPPAVLDELRRASDGGVGNASRRLAAWKDMIERGRASICVSSWHMNDQESEAMWKLYGRHEDGLAIVSTLAAIKHAFRDHEVTGGLVDYSGCEFEAGTTGQTLLRWATTKRPSYKCENEFRLLARRDLPGTRPRDHRDGSAGLEVPVDPDALIGEVVLSPRMERWQRELFQHLTQRLGFQRPVRESSLLTLPF
jgi:hypothetical protein